MPPPLPCNGPKMGDRSSSVCRCKRVLAVRLFWFDHPLNPSHTRAITPYWGLLGVRPRMDRFTILSITLYAIWIIWLCLAIRLYQKIDSRFSGTLPVLHSRMQPLTNWPSAWALIKFLSRVRISTIDDLAIRKYVYVLRWLSSPILLLWGYVLYLQTLR
jgi:hypothetical protein